MDSTEEQTCRLCTIQGTNYTPIFRKSEGNVGRMIRCLPVQIRSGDGLPNHICPGCLDALEVSYNLHILCLKANLELLERSSIQRRKKLLHRERSRLEVKTREKKSSEDDSDSGKDPIIIETYHFPEAVYNDLSNHKDFSEIFQRVPEVKLERLDDNLSWSSGQDVNHNDLSIAFVDTRCKQEPLDIDEPGPSGHQEQTVEMKEESDSSIFGNSKVITFRDPQRTCKNCGRTASAKEFRLIKRKNNRIRVRADRCNMCDNRKPRIYNRKLRTIDQPCWSIENSQEPESYEPNVIQDFDDFKNFHVSNEHSYARFARSCALKTIWKQQLARVTSPSNEKKSPKEKQVPLRHPCLFCGKTCVSSIRLKYHIAVQHTPPERWEHHCDLCGATFPVRGDLLRHQASGHTHERKFTCDVCPLTFVSHKSLMAHRTLRHVNIPNYKKES
ncbi:zinc finger protein 549 [Diachasma alloeum]|uniref:zinc finger protein 549 n=1 Tax=Diachasma alloeum TaxID=454923 RepID=UPI00073842F2|nr:zinc finger protein 549 [Diachasma alloeum]